MQTGKKKIQGRVYVEALLAVPEPHAVWVVGDYQKAAR